MQVIRRHGDGVRQRRGSVWRCCCMVLGLVLGQLVVAPAHEQHHPKHAAKRQSVARPEVSVGRLTIPDVELVNQHGETVHVYRDLIADKVVAINFIYTTCSTICLPMGANFGQLQHLLHNPMPEDVRLISVSVDPVIDTPQRLRAWGANFHPGPNWTLLTGAKQDVDQLLKALQVFTPDKADHSPIVLIGNTVTETWTRVNGLASPATLARLLRSAIAGSSTAQEARP